MGRLLVGHNANQTHVESEISELVFGPSFIVIFRWVDVWAIFVDSSLVDVSPVVIPHAAPIVATDDATHYHEAIETRGALKEDFVDASVVEGTEEPVQRIFPLARVFVP